jgi:hypothetical protein
VRTGKFSDRKVIEQEEMEGREGDRIICVRMIF